MPKAAANVTSLPSGVEIFRAGRHVDDTGKVRVFTTADVQRMAEVYDPAQREAPLTIGHPEHNLPSYGFVQRLGVNAAGRLAMDTHQVPVEFAEIVEAGRYKKRSASFYPPGHPNNPVPDAWYLRHVAFLGAQPPAIAGLADIQFSEGDTDGVVQFSEESIDPSTQEQDDMSKELQEQLEAANKKLAEEQAARERAEAESKKHKDQLAQFAEQQREQRQAAYVSFAEAQIEAGRWLPKNKLQLVAALERLGDGEVVSFSEGDTTTKVDLAQWLQDVISSAKPVVSFGEHAPDQVPGADRGAGKGKTDAEVDKLARDYSVKNKVSYAEALNAVVSFTD